MREIGREKLFNYLTPSLILPTVFRKVFEEEEVYANMAITIARLRESSGISQNELARMVGTTQQTISRIEDPRNHSITVNTLVKIAGALGKKLQIKIA